MKKNILVFLFSILVLQQIQAQVKGDASYLVKYEVKFKLDSTNREEVKQEVHRLYTGANVSYYTNEGNIYKDSVIKALEEQILLNRSGGINIQKAKMPSLEFHAVVYKDLVASKLWVKNSIASVNLYYQEPGVPIQWEFTDDTKQIEPYTALKATTSFGGRDYEAWFTLDVPILDGPYVFSGLPGLILELYDTKGDYHFNLASLVPLKTSYPIDLQKEKAKLVSKEEFVKAFIKHRANPGSGVSGRFPANFQMRDASGKTITSKDLERQVKEASDKRNNQIEIWK